MMTIGAMSMKEILFNIFKSFFNREINSLIKEETSKDSLKKSHWREVSKSKKNESIRINYPKGKKVIFIGNTPTEELIIGHVVGYEEVSKEKNLLPIIKVESTGEEIMCLSPVFFYWTEDREAVFKKLTWWERWNVASKYTSTFSEKSAKELEERLKKDK